MSKVIVVVGFGPGVSKAVGEKFGAEGFAIALVARNEERLAAGVQELKAIGIAAAAFAADAGDPSSIRAAIANIRSEFGQIGAIHWNAFSGQGSGDLLTVDPVDLKGVFDVAVVGLLSAVQEALPDLKATSDGAILVTNGAYGEISPSIDQFAIAFKAEGVALANAAKAKLVGLLTARLKDEGIFVGEVTIAGVVKGTGPESPGVPTIESASIANAFWTLYHNRSDNRVRLS